jgi:hypothetical protein
MTVEILTIEKLHNFEYNMFSFILDRREASQAINHDLQINNKGITILRLVYSNVCLRFNTKRNIMCCGINFLEKHHKFLLFLANQKVLVHILL